MPEYDGLSPGTGDPVRVQQLAKSNSERVISNRPDRLQVKDFREVEGISGVDEIGLDCSWRGYMRSCYDIAKVRHEPLTRRRSSELTTAV